MSEPTTLSGGMLAAFLHGLVPEVETLPREIAQIETEAAAPALARAEKAEAALLRVKLAAVEVVIEATATDFDPSTREWGELIEALDAAIAAPSGDEEARR